MNMDKMHINGLEVFAYHGIFEEEKNRGQKFVMDITLEADLRPACDSDSLEDTIDYGAVCETVENVMREKKCDLIECAAQRVIQALFARFDKIAAVSLYLRKPQAPVISRIEYAAVEIYRRREDF